MNSDKPKFVSCSVHLSDHPWSMLECDPPALHHQHEAIEKMHRLCHGIYRVPITWLCSWSALQKYQDRLVDFVKNYGDEVAIMESGIFSSELLDGEVEKYQSWVEECGMKRPDAEFHSATGEELRPGAYTMQDMPYEQQKTMLAYLKKRYDEILGQNTRSFASPMNNGDTIRAMKEVGLDVSQGYCWDYFCEGINHKGCLLQPFNVSSANQVAPDQETGGPSVLAIQWGPISPVIAAHTENHARMGMPGYCLNALELTNRSEGHDKFRFHEKVIQEWYAQAAWNSFAFAPLQLEACWMDESEMPESLYDQYPRFNSRNTEVFYSEIETALRCGAKPVTLSQFADWHREHVRDTAPSIFYAEDHMPDLRSKGKDQPYQPMIVYGDKEKQYWFSKSRGMNYTRRYLYDPLVPNSEIEEEYPFDNEPKVFLKVKSAINIQAGIRLTMTSAIYEIGSLDLSAYHDDAHYAAALWEANVPSYISDDEIEIGGGITGFRTLREKNAALVFGNLKKGLNQLILRSEKPSRYVRIKKIEKVGKRYEIWIQNDGDEVQLHSLQVKLEPGLKIGGFWWDGYYSHTLFRYGWAGYDRKTGELDLRCFYPITLKVNAGLTRCSIELF